MKTTPFRLIGGDPCIHSKHPRSFLTEILSVSFGSLVFRIENKISATKLILRTIELLENSLVLVNGMKPI